MLTKKEIAELTEAQRTGRSGFMRGKSFSRESTLQKLVLEALQLRGWMCIVPGFRSQRSSCRWRAKGAWFTSGVSDIIAMKNHTTINGKSVYHVPEVVFIELKSGNGKPSLEQKEFAGAVRACGFEYVLASTLEEVLEVCE